MDFDIDSLMQGLAHWAIPVLLAICLHEAAHGYVAWRLGDDTAKRLGRVTINPFAHIHPIGTILLPALLFLAKSPFLFGFAKPVPVNFARLRHPKTDMIWVALAGPGMNIFLAFVSVLLMHAVQWGGAYASLIEENLSNSVMINLGLAVFNMFPVPPLDGGRILTGILPLRWAIPYSKLESYGLFILVGVMFVLPLIGEHYGLDLDLFSRFMQYGISFLGNIVLLLAGGLSH